MSRFEKISRPETVSRKDRNPKNQNSKNRNSKHRSSKNQKSKNQKVKIQKSKFKKSRPETKCQKSENVEKFSKCQNFPDLVSESFQSSLGHTDTQFKKSRKNF